MRVLLFVLTLSACDEATSPVTQRCDIALSSLSPEEGAPGTPVAAALTPITQSWDTVVHVGGIDAAVDSVMRTNCETCDTCRTEENCDDCEACAACDDACRETCIETVQFTVPDMAPGSHATSLVNKHGHSNSLMFTVLAQPDTGESDTAAQ